MYQQIFKLIILPLVLACFGLSPRVQAANETTSNANTGEGNGALQSITTGSNNTGLGAGALFSVTTGVQNTATGAQALNVNTGDSNTADGFQALVKNTTGPNNAATGWRALFSNTTGDNNTADGNQALYRNTGSLNTATGSGALLNNTAGTENTATGFGALGSNKTGVFNTAVGSGALDANTTGNRNIALGRGAGFNLTTGDDNIDIGNPGVAAEAATIRIGDFNQTATFIAGISGTPVTGTTVVVTSDGQLGVGAGSSARFKTEIKPMEKASEAILALKPVTFRYKKEIDPKKTAQFGLVAEEVEKVNPALITRDHDGKPFTVRYDAVNAMLLNEFLKEHRKVEEQGAIIAKQQKQIDALTAGLQKVNDQLELTKPAPRTVLNDH